jgi:hypothetical protein
MDEKNGDEFFILIDEKRFTQIIRSIITNAIRNTPRGGTVGVFVFLVNNETHPMGSVRCAGAWEEEGHRAMRIRTYGKGKGKVRIEVHDSGPLLTEVSTRYCANVLICSYVHMIICSYVNSKCLCINCVNYVVLMC